MSTAFFNPVLNFFVIGRRVRSIVIPLATIDLLLDVGQLRVTKSGEEFQRRDPAHQVAILSNNSSGV
jgi:hypothetical protein